MTQSPNARLERPNIWPWPPILVVVFLLAGFAFNQLVPLGWLPGFAGEMARGLGLILIAVALLIDIAAMRTMSAARTTIMPHRGSEHLVTAGPFRFSRNPIYLANVLLLAGIGLVTQNVWLVLLAPLQGYATQKLAIEREEAHLEARFSKTYRDYKKRVNRWL